MIAATLPHSSKHNYGYTDSTALTFTLAAHVIAWVSSLFGIGFGLILKTKNDVFLLTACSWVWLWAHSGAVACASISADLPEKRIDPYDDDHIERDDYDDDEDYLESFNESIRASCAFAWFAASSAAFGACAAGWLARPRMRFSCQKLDVIFSPLLRPETTTTVTQPAPRAPVEEETERPPWRCTYYAFLLISNISALISFSLLASVHHTDALSTLKNLEGSTPGFSVAAFVIVWLATGFVGVYFCIGCSTVSFLPACREREQQRN